MFFTTPPAGKKSQYAMFVLAASAILFALPSQAKTLINKNPNIGNGKASAADKLISGSIDKCLVTEQKSSNDWVWILFSCRDLDDASQKVYQFRRPSKKDGVLLNGMNPYDSVLVYASKIKVNQIYQFNFSIDSSIQGRLKGVPRDRLSTDLVYTTEEPVILLGNLDEYNKKPRKLSLSDRLESGMGKNISAITKVLQKLPTTTYELPQGNKLFRWVNRYSDYDKNIYLSCNQEFYTNSKDTIIGWYHDCPEDIFQGNIVSGNTPRPKPKPVELSVEAIKSRVKPTY